MIEPLQVTLPWPPRACSPNQRQHWSRLAAAKKGYRYACQMLTRDAGGQRMPADSRLHLALTFVPPDRRRRDLDNLIASMKSGLDGIADALGVDDSRWRLSFALDESGAIAGLVRVNITRQRNEQTAAA